MNTIFPPKLLTEAENITSGDRRKDYGRPYINHLRIARKWARRLRDRQIRGLPIITPAVVVMLMKDLKEARNEHAPKFDNILDDVGYTTCLDDMAREMIELGYAKTYEDALYLLDRQDIDVMEHMYELLEPKQREG